MGDTLQVGGIEAKLTLDTQEFACSVQDSEGKFRGLYTQVNTMPPALQKLEAQQAKVTRQLEEQKKKVGELYAALDTAAADYVALEKAMGRVGDVNLEKTFAAECAAIDREEKKLSELKAQLQQVENQRAQTIEKLNADATKQGATQQYKENSLAIDSVANSLRALTPILGDSIGNVGNLAERLVFMKQSMKSAASEGALMGVAISGGITLAVSAIAMLTQAGQKAASSGRGAPQWGQMCCKVPLSFSQPPFS